MHERTTFDRSAHRRFRSIGVSSLIRTVALAVLAVASTALPLRADEPVERFLAGLDAWSEVAPEARELIRQGWAECDDCDGEEFLTQALALLSEPFRAGLDAYHADKSDACVTVMASIRDDPNPFLAVHAAVYEIKALVTLDRLVEALERIEGLTRKDDTDLAQDSYFDAEVDFLRGYCLVSSLDYDDGAAALRRFLADHPDASQRLTLTARQMLAELANWNPGGLAEIADLMTYCGRRLRHRDAGELVQLRQERVVDLLDQLIEQAEQAESSSDQDQSGGGPQPQRNPQAPMPDSRLPEGDAQGGELGSTPRINPGEVWGSMPPSEREQVLQALREHFPTRYRRLVEQYFEQLAKKK